MSKREKVKLIPVPSNLTYQNVRDFRNMLYKHDMGEAAQHIITGWNEMITDFNKVKKGIKQALERQHKRADLMIKKITEGLTYE